MSADAMTLGLLGQDGSAYPQVDLTALPSLSPSSSNPTTNPAGNTNGCPALTDCSIANLMGKPWNCWAQCLNPANWGGELSQGPLDSQGRGAVNAAGNALGAVTNVFSSMQNVQQLIVEILVGVLAIGIVFIGIKQISEA